MNRTDLLKKILEAAGAVQQKSGCQQLCASHIAVAVADFCKTRYTGLDLYAYSFPRYEEERLRYLFSRLVKAGFFFAIQLRRNTKDGVQEDAFDFDLCRRITSGRGVTLLSAELVFLCALSQLHSAYIPALHAPVTEDRIPALLQDTDAGIYDYVIENVGGIVNELNQKLQEATAIRDWKPAPCFASPEELAQMFFSKIQISPCGNVCTLKIPAFFGTTDLKVTVYQVQNIYYVHDNGCALRHLSKQVKDKEKRRRILDRICFSCFIRQKRIIGSFCTVNSFLLYLQDLVFIAQADLYYTRSSRLLHSKNYPRSFADEAYAEPLDTEALLAELKKAISFSYDENTGLYYLLDMRYSLSSVRCVCSIESTPDGRIRISDRRKGNFEGEIFENFYFGNDDLTPYSRFITKIASRFGGEFDGKNIYLTEKPENFFKAAVKFFNMAVILSLFGQKIALR